MKRLTAFLLAAVMCLSMSACGRVTPPAQSQSAPPPVQIEPPEPIDASGEESSCDRIDLAALLAETTAAHREKTLNAQLTTEMLIPYLTPMEGDGDLLTAAQTQKLLKGGWVPKTVTKAQALEDVDILFRVFQSAYGSYYYFGHEQFQTARAQVEKWIDSQPDVVGVWDLSDTMYAALDFVKDGHTTLDGRPLGQMEYRYYYNYDQRFAFDGVNYYKVFADGTYRLTEISDKQARLEPTLTPEGELVWSPMLCITGEEPGPCTVTMVNDDGQVKYQSFEWTVGEPLLEIYSSPDFSQYFENGIAYASLRSFAAFRKNDTIYKEVIAFINTGAKFKDAQVVILDIRGNAGGVDDYHALWFEDFAGDVPVEPLVMTKRNSALHAACNPDRPSNTPFGQFSEPFCTEPHFVENPIPVILLVDNMTISAGESWLRKCATMENVLIVGTNSYGAALGGSAATLYLPNSRFSVAIATGGPQFAYEPKLVEFYGFEPDVWCNGKYALEAVINMLGVYGYATDEVRADLAEQTVRHYTKGITLEVANGSMAGNEVGLGQGFGSIDNSMKVRVMYNGESVNDFTAWTDVPDRCKITVTDGILSFGGSHGEDNRLYIQVGDEMAYFYQNS